MKNKTIDDFVKISFATVQDDDASENAKIYGYFTKSVGDMIPNHNLYVVPDPNGLNESMVKKYWGDFMKYTGFSVEDVLDFIERNVVNSRSTMDISSFTKI